MTAKAVTGTGESFLNERVAIVTGASRGIGAAVATALAKHGTKVALAARSSGEIEELRQKIQAGGGVAIAVKADVSSRTDMREVVRQAEESLGPIDILVNNAAAVYLTYMKSCHEEEWNTMVDVNCKGVLNGIAAVLDGMMKRGSGHIVNMSSDSGRVPEVGLAVYSGTKFFVEGLTKALRFELKDTGIKVTSIQPGYVQTSLWDRSVGQEAHEALAPTPEMEVLNAEDVADAVVYACSQPSHVAVNEILVQPRQYPA